MAERRPRALVGDIRGAHYAQTVPAHELRRVRELQAAVTLGGRTVRHTIEIRSADGRILRVESIVVPLRKEGRIVGAWGIVIPAEDAEPHDEAATELPPRQLDVLRLLVEGKSTRQIAEELHLAPETVRNYVAGLLKALGARSRLEAAVIALRRGLVSLDLD